jgi:HEPN domain-containing protein
MGLGYKRTDLRAMAQAKLDDAVLLLQNGRFSNAYYLAGYAVELALKACIAAQFVADVIPDKSLVNAIYRHTLKDLVGTAGLT